MRENRSIPLLLLFFFFSCIVHGSMATQLHRQPTQLASLMARACLISPLCSAKYVTKGAGGIVTELTLARDIDFILDSHGMSTETKQRVLDASGPSLLTSLALDLRQFCVAPEECIDDRSLQYYMPGILSAIAVTVMMFAIIFYIELSRGPV